MTSDKGVTKVIKVTPYVKELMLKVTKIVAVETGGEIIGINNTLRHVLEGKINE